VLSQASLGMVTEMTYSVTLFHTGVHSGVQASLTGWSYLAVILGSARSAWEFEKL
jgi:hypothetical protein